MAKNTLLLYFRMLLLLFVGLFTSRIVLQCLGVEDYGTYNVVYSVIMMFTVLSNSINSSVSRFLAYEIGTGDGDRLKNVFSGAVIIQIGMCVLMVVLAETLGLWYFHNGLNIPEGRSDSAMWVFQASVILLAIQLMSLPFNCAIIAHEDMKAFAGISLLEGFLKLAIALILLYSGADKLILYAILMASVALIVRITYALYCKRHYQETLGALSWDWQTIRSMLSLGAWSFTAQGVGVFNTQGVNLLTNSFFGVAVNAARGVAGQIENITRQFVSNFLTALNPLITKTWAEGNRDYCFELVRKGCKFSFLIALLIAVPFIFESEFILSVWLGRVPEGAAVFTTLTILCVLSDMMSNSLAQLVIANGRVARYYVITSCVSALTFLLSWLAFANGMPAYLSYCLSVAVFCIIAIIRLMAVSRMCGFPVLPFVRETVYPVLIVSAGSVIATWLPCHFMTGGIVRSCVCIVVALVSVCVLSFALALTPGERQYVVERFRIRR